MKKIYLLKNEDEYILYEFELAMEILVKFAACISLIVNVAIGILWLVEKYL